MNYNDLNNLTFTQLNNVKNMVDEISKQRLIDFKVAIEKNDTKYFSNFSQWGIPDYESRNVWENIHFTEKTAISTIEALQSLVKNSYPKFSPILTLKTQQMMTRFVERNEPVNIYKNPALIDYINWFVEKNVNLMTVTIKNNIHNNWGSLQNAIY